MPQQLLQPQQMLAGAAAFPPQQFFMPQQPQMPAGAAALTPQQQFFMQQPPQMLADAVALTPQQQLFMQQQFAALAQRQQQPQQSPQPGGVLRRLQDQGRQPW